MDLSEQETPQRRPDVAAVEPVGVDVAVAVPAGPVGARDDRAAGRGARGCAGRWCSRRPSAHAVVRPRGRRGTGRSKTAPFQVARTPGVSSAKRASRCGEHVGLGPVEHLVAAGLDSATVTTAADRRIEPVDRSCRSRCRARTRAAVARSAPLRPRCGHRQGRRVASGDASGRTVEQLGDEGGDRAALAPGQRDVAEQRVAPQRVDHRGDAVVAADAEVVALGDVVGEHDPAARRRAATAR